jgi:hypothetical protein
MMGRVLAASAVAFVVTATSCSSDTSAGADEGGGVGAPCSADAQCTGYAKPSCAKDVKPIANLVDPSDPNNKTFVDFHVPFPGGYCSNTIENSCTSDADCGAGAGCFRPFENVSQDTINTLNQIAGLPFDVNSFATFALCLKTCKTAADCRTSEGYECDIPLKAFMATIDGGFDKKFCFVNVDDQIMGLFPSAPDAGP